MSEAGWQWLIERAHRLLDRLEATLPPAPPPFAEALAYRWLPGEGGLHPVRTPRLISLDDLLGIETQKAAVVANTRQFILGLPCNHVLLTGARGTGKSSLVRGLLDRFGVDGLRLVEIGKSDLGTLPRLTELLAGRQERYLLFCDDLSFVADEPGYQALKALLDGTVAGVADNMALIATSNRRHLMPDYFADNESRPGEIHPREAVEEKVSLSDRFGLWLHFYPQDEAQFVAVARHWVSRLGQEWDEEAIAGARQWSLARGRSGRSAVQFARDLAGRRGLPD